MIAVDDSTRLSKEHMESLRKIGDVKLYPAGCDPEEFFDRCRDANALLVNKTLHMDVLGDTSVKLISLWSTGYDVVDTEKCRELGIAVTNVPGYSKDSVAEHTICLILELSKKLSMQQHHMREKGWKQEMEAVMELKGKTLGIIGMGSIGSRVAAIAEALGMKVIYYSRSKKGKQERVELDELMERSDFISVHCPLKKETEGLISETELSLMKKNAYIINTARGPIIDEDALIGALKTGRIAGAALDVFREEPLPKGSELRKLDNIILTPHAAFFTRDALKRLGDISISNIRDYFEGRMTNRVV